MGKQDFQAIDLPTCHASLESDEGHAGGACLWERGSKWHHDAWGRAWLIKLFSEPLLASFGKADPGVFLLCPRYGRRRVTV